MGELPLRGAAAGLQKCRGCFLEISRCAGLLDWRNAEAAFGGAPAARGCWITDMRRLLLGAAFAARGCSLGVRKRLLLRDLPLRGAARLGKCRGCFLGSSRCVGLLAWSKEEAALGGAPAARGCWIQTGGGCFRGSSRCAGLLDTDRRRLLQGELPLRGAARLEKCRGCFWGSSRCAGLLDWRNAAAAFGGAPAARGCSLGVRKRLLLGELPLRGAARLEKCRGCFWGSSRCAGLLDYRQEEAAFGGAPAARGCSLGVRKRLLLGELPLRGAAG